MSKETNASRSQQNIPVSFGKPSLRRRLEAYYSLISPSAIANQKEWLEKFDLIYKKYGGSQEKEEKLSTKLAKKYGSTVKLLVATNMDGNRQKQRQRVVHDTKMDVETRDESWFDLNDLELNSGVTDFTSSCFDPHAALYTDESLLSSRYKYVKNAPRLDNISKARVLLADFDPQRVVKSKPARLDNAMEPTQLKTKSKKVPVLTTLASQFQTGPLSIMYRCHIQRKRVRVMIRYVDCIRGTLTGYLLAFDKHLNMILTDVDEVYSRRITKVLDQVENVSKSEMEILRRNCNFNLNEPSSDLSIWSKIGTVSKTKLSAKQRHCSQLLVRGDNVVMVWKAEAEKSVPVEKAMKNIVGTPGSLIPQLSPHYQTHTPAGSQRFDKKRRNHCM